MGDWSFLETSLASARLFQAKEPRGAWHRLMLQVQTYDRAMYGWAGEAVEC